MRQAISTGNPYKDDADSRRETPRKDAITEDGRFGMGKNPEVLKKALKNIEGINDKESLMAVASLYDAFFFLFEVDYEDARKIAEALARKCEEMGCPVPEAVSMAVSGPEAMSQMYREWISERAKIFGGELIVRSDFDENDAFKNGKSEVLHRDENRNLNEMLDEDRES